MSAQAGLKPWRLPVSVTFYSTKTLPATSTLGRRVRVTNVATGDSAVMFAGPLDAPELAAVMIFSGEPSSAVTFHGERHGETFYITGLRLV